MTNEPYERADGKVVHLGQEVPAPSSEAIVFSAIRVRRGDALFSCGTCKAAVAYADTGAHAAWHRELTGTIRDAALTLF